MTKMILSALMAMVSVPALPAWSAPADGKPMMDLAKAKFTSSAEPVGPKSVQAVAADGGWKFTLDMGPKRTNWTNARWSVCEFEKPLDLRGSEGIALLVATDKPRRDAGVFLALKEAGGTWYSCSWACPLTQAANTAVARFVDFATADWHCPPGGTHVDSNWVLDLDRISAIAIGCVNPMGVGEVSFTVKTLALAPASQPQTAAARIDVTGKLMDVNGTRDVPAGVFGGFNLPGGCTKKYRLAMYKGGVADADPVITHMVIYGQGGDRVGASPRAKSADWEKSAQEAGAKLGQKAKETGKTVYAEYYNEPYLNWANKNRIAFNPALYDESKAAEGGPVCLKIDGSECPFLHWTKDFTKPTFQWCKDLQEWRRGRDAKGAVYSPVHAQPYRPGALKPAMHPPDSVKDGEKYKVTVKDPKAGDKELELTAFTPWHIYDETQFTFWSGKGMLKFYNDPMIATGKAMKAACKDKTVYIAGWGFRPSEDHWDGFRLLYQPTIDAGIDVIDGVCDHDYGGDPVKMSGVYEFTTAYGVTKHKKWLYSFNTECASATDSQAIPEAAGLNRDAAANLRKFAWTAAKILHAIEYAPDKARSMAHFGNANRPESGPWFSHDGEGKALTMMINLRGKLVQALSTDPNILVAGAIDGTDPLNPRPAEMGDRKELVVAVMNIGCGARDVELKIAAPTGTSFGEGTIRKNTYGKDAVEVSESKAAASGTAFAFGHNLGVRELAVLTLPLTGTPADKAQVTQRQFFSKDLLADVSVEKPLKTAIAVDEAALKGAKRAMLSLVVERLGQGEGTVAINGKDYALPAGHSAENTPVLRRLEIDASGLRAVNELEFKVSPAQAGYFIAAASVIVVSE